MLLWDFHSFLSDSQTHYFFFMQQQFLGFFSGGRGVQVDKFYAVYLDKTLSANSSEKLHNTSLDLSDNSASQCFVPGKMRKTKLSLHRGFRL